MDLSFGVKLRHQALGTCMRSMIPVRGRSVVGPLTSLCLAIAIASCTTPADPPPPAPEEPSTGVRRANVAGHRGVLFAASSGVAVGPYPLWTPTDHDLAWVEARLDGFLRNDSFWPLPNPERLVRQYWGIEDGGRAVRIMLYCAEWSGWTEGPQYVSDDHQCHPEVHCFIDKNRCFRIQ